jgi:2-octaprenyl-6-methoxyphenol hydroxylase
VVATLALERPHRGVAHQHFLPGGPLAILPLVGDASADHRASLVWAERTERAAALVAASPQAFEAHLARRFGEMLGRPRLIGPRLIYPLRLQTADRITGARIALIGDAAHVIHPIAGQGLNLGLKDVAALAEVLIEAARSGEDIGAEGVLGRYARWRRFDGAGLAMATDLLNRLFSNDFPPLRLARDIGVAAINRTPTLRRIFMQEAGAGLGDIPALLRGERP